MSIIMSIHKKWNDAIFNGTKEYEFRKNIGVNDWKDKTVYIYETKKNKGTGKIVGEFIIEDIILVNTMILTDLEIIKYNPKYAIKISKIKKYIKSKELSDFKKNNIAPQSWCYC